MEELSGRWDLDVLAAVARLRGNAYGVSIMDEVSKRNKKEVAYGSIHVTLDRLKDQGFLTAKMGDPTPQRGGRRKRFYEITGKGESALAEARTLHKRRFGGLGWLKPAVGEG